MSRAGAARPLGPEHFIAFQPEQKRTLARQRALWNKLAGRLFEIGGNRLVIPLSPDSELFPFDIDADRCPACVAEMVGTA